MFDLIKEAKENKHGVVFRDYQKPNITWEELLTFIFKESKKENPTLLEKTKRHPEFLSCVGNIQVQDGLWLAPQTNGIFEEFNGVSELLYKLNDSKENRECKLYKQETHDCDLDWHYQGIRMSLSDRFVGDHHDPHDIFYWQIVGTSFWRIDNDITYELKPGDMLYLPLENSHAVWCEGPRAGLLIDNWSNINQQTE